MGRDAGTVLSWVHAAFGGFETATEVRHGAFHEVVVADHGAARVLIGSDQAARATRECAVLARLPERLGPVELPRLLSSPVSRQGRVGYLTSRLPGSDDAPGRDALQMCADVLDRLHRLVPAPGLPPVRAWCGGDRLAAMVGSRFSAQLGESHREAVRLAGAVENSRARHRVFVHGDFGPHNLLWDDGGPVGLLDFDHAAVADPAVDYAPLVGFYGATAVSGITDEATLARAMLHRATLPLQVAAAAELCGLPALRDHALGNFRRRWSSDTLFDPEGIVSN